MTYTPQEEEIGYVLVGRTAAAASLVVENIGDGNKSELGDESNLRGNITISEGADNFLATGGSISLIDEAKQQFDFVFKPTKIGEIGAMTIAAEFVNGDRDGYNQPDSETYHYSSGTAVAPVMEIINEDAQNAGLVRVGTSGTASITIKNVGNGNLSEVGNESNLNGVLMESTGVFAHAMEVFNLEDDQSKAFQYTFLPTTRGTASTDIEIIFGNGSRDGTNSDHTEYLTLSGTSVGPVYASDREVESTLGLQRTRGGRSRLRLPCRTTPMMKTAAIRR